MQRYNSTCTRSRPRLRWVFTLWFVLMQLTHGAQASEGMSDCNTGKDMLGVPRSGWLLTWENDSVIGPYAAEDEFYTQGMQLGYRMTPDGQPLWLSRPMASICRFLTKSQSQPSTLVGAGSVFLGQHFFTPSDITEPGLIEDDRAYAAWLYVGTRLEVTQKFAESQRLITGLFHTFELQVGTLGPRAQGEWVQTRWHEVIHDEDVPMGWDHQLPNEFGLQARYAVRGLVADLPRKQQELWNGWQLQGTLDGDLNVGTVLDTASVGTTWRFGRNLGDPVALGLEPAKFKEAARPECLPALAISECYVFAGIAGRAVGYNAFLDGTMFHGGHSVDKDPFVYDVSAGIRLGWRQIQLDYTSVWRSREFSPVPDSAQVKSGRHGFGAINLRCFAPIGNEAHRWDLLCPGIFALLLTAIATK